MYDCLCDLLTFFLVIPCLMCVCVCACILCPSLGIQSRSIFVPHISHQYFTPSPPLLSFFTRSPSLSWASVWGFFYTPTHTIEGLTDWPESHRDDMSCIWCCKGAATARWLQTILLLFLFILNLPTVGWQGPTHSHTFSAIHRGVVQYKQSLWFRVI